MICPKCKATMETVDFADVEVDRCSNCHGIWFDEFELDELKDVKGAADIDDGDPEVGAAYNAVDHIDCPRCHTQMIRMVHMEQSHIWYESCTVCFGAFLDAGEFKDLTDNTLVDWIKDLLSKERR